MAHSVIEHKSAPTSNVFAFTSINFSPFKFCILEVVGVVVDTDDIEISLQVYQSGSLLSAAGSYAYYQLGYRSSSVTGLGENSDSATSIILAETTAAVGVGNAAGEAFTARIEIFNAGAGFKTGFTTHTAYTNAGGNLFRATGSAHVKNTTAIDGLHIAGVGGLITSGKATLIGYS